MQELHPDFSVFPTYSIILPFKKEEAEVIDFYAAQNVSSMSIPGAPKLDSKRVVDGERSIIFYKPLPASSKGRKFEVHGKVIGVYDKGKPGTVVETQNDLVDAETGELYTRATGMGFYVGQGNWGWSEGPEVPELSSAGRQEARCRVRASDDSGLGTSVQTQWRLQPTPRHAGTGQNDGFRRRNHARLILLEHDRAWSS